MKLKITPLFIAAVMVTIATITACSKKNDTAVSPKVIYSNWDTLKYVWKDSTTDEIGKAFYNYIDVPLIDSTILKQGEVKVFMKSDIDTIAYPLPKTFQGDDLTNFIFTTKKIILYNQLVGKNMPPTSAWIRSTIQFRYIIIPGGILATARTQQTEDYQSLCKGLGIPE